jgi:hypothetical protein
MASKKAAPHKPAAALILMMTPPAMPKMKSAPKVKSLPKMTVPGPFGSGPGSAKKKR